MTLSNSEPIFIGPDGSNTEVTAKTAGSKAAMLWRMGRLGLAVPPAFVMPNSLCAPVNSGADVCASCAGSRFAQGHGLFGEGDRPPLRGWAATVTRFCTLRRREIHAGDAGDNSRCRA